jgi:PAS domain S-box-containing protein
LQSIGDAVIATDAEGRITMMNPVAEEATGWKSAAATGLPLESVFKIVNESSREPAESPVRKVLDRGRIAGLANHTVLLRLDGTEIPIDDSAAPIRDRQGRIVGVVMVFRDITKQRLSEKALLRAEKLSAAGRLAATIAHEMNNPLEAVCNLLYLLGKDGTLSAHARANVDMAQAQLARAAEVSRRTLSFCKAANVLTDTRISVLVESVVGSYASLAEARGGRIENDTPPDLEIPAMTNEMRQVISNLVSNALDAMPEGGTLHIGAETVEGLDQTQVQIIFSDTGHGIDPAHLDRIFEPFFTTKKETGTGLGLWVTQRIVEEHGGRLRVESSVAGTRFAVLLPLESAKYPVPSVTT